MIVRMLKEWRASKLLVRAQAAARAGDWECAREASSRACELSNCNIDALGLLGLASFRLQKFQQAVDCYSEILLRKPDDVPARRNMAMAFAKMKQWKQAHVLFSELAAERPEDREICEAHAFVAAKLSAPTPATTGNDIRSAIANGDWPQVMALARGKLAVEPGNVDAMLHLGMALYRSEHIVQAKEWFQKAAAATVSGKMVFRHAPALNNLATTCMRLGHWTGAIEALEALRSMIKYGTPGTQKIKQSNVLINLLVCYREVHRPRQAKAMYQLLIEVDPATAARIDPGDLNVPLGAPLKSAAQLGAELILADHAYGSSSSLASGAQREKCPACGASVEPGHNFCGACGHALAMMAGNTA